MEDSLILDLFWNRSESAIQETAKKYGRYCHAIANNILRNNEDAEECVNDTYLTVWGIIPPQRPGIFRAFLGKITRNLSLNKYREQRMKKRGGGEVDLLLSELEECIPSGGTTETEHDAKEIIEIINSCLMSLDIDSRNVFVRRYWYAEPVKGIAVRYQMSESKVKSMLLRTRGKLKQYLEKREVII